MSNAERVVVVGLGEVGRPLCKIVSRRHETMEVDLSLPIPPVVGPDVMHICYPFSIADFIGETCRYIERFQPRLTIINSTVGVGATRAVAERTGAAVVHSPVRGKHVRMVEDLLYYRKFVGGLDRESSLQAARHFESVGMKTTVLASPEATELAKLTETTYFGLLIAWAQQIERYCDQLGQAYDEIVSFYDEINYLPPVRYVPGVIGGHCVMPNIDILGSLEHSGLLDAIIWSNKRKIQKSELSPSAASVLSPAGLDLPRTTGSPACEAVVRGSPVQIEK